AQLLVSYLTTPEVNGRFYFVSLLKDPGRMVLLKIVIVFVGAGPELNLFDGYYGLFGLGLLGFRLLLVLPFPEIDNATDGRTGLGRDLDQIQTFAAGDFQPALGAHYSKLSPVVINNADLSYPDPLVNPNRWRALSPSIESSTPSKAADSLSSRPNLTRAL